MTAAFDDRLVQLEIQLLNQKGEAEGDPYVFDQSYYIAATGVKFTDGSLNECAVRIDNISKQTRDFLVNKCSPWRVPRLYANITLSVGRKSKGVFMLFTGQATAINPTQPPDIGLTFQSLTMGALLGNIGSLQTGSLAPLKSICRQIANKLPNPKTGKPGIPLDYQAKYDPNVQNYWFNGSLVRQIDKINAIGGVNAFIDNNTLTVVDTGKARIGSPKIINKYTGMIGVPEVNGVGVRARVLVSDEIRPADSITIQSDLNAAANGTFIVYRLGYEIASRDVPFYWDIDMRANLIGIGTQS